VRDFLAFLFIRLARRLTTWGFTDDHLLLAERQQHGVLSERLAQLFPLRGRTACKHERIDHNGECLDCDELVG